MSEQAKQINAAIEAEQAARAKCWDGFYVETLAIDVGRRVTKALSALRLARSDLMGASGPGEAWDWAREVEPMIHGLMGGVAVVAALLAEVVADTALEDPAVAELVAPEATP